MRIRFYNSIINCFFFLIDTSADLHIAIQIAMYLYNVYIDMHISWWVYFVTGSNLVLQQPSTAVLAKTKADITKESSYFYSSCWSELIIAMLRRSFSRVYRVLSICNFACYVNQLHIWSPVATWSADIDGSFFFVTSQYPNLEKLEKLELWTQEIIDLHCKRKM